MTPTVTAPFVPLKVVLPLAEVSEARKRELHDAAAMGLEHVVEIMLQLGLPLWYFTVTLDPYLFWGLLGF